MNTVSQAPVAGTVKVDGNVNLQIALDLLMQEIGENFNLVASTRSWEVAIREPEIPRRDLAPVAQMDNMMAKIVAATELVRTTNDELRNHNEFITRSFQG